MVWSRALLVRGRPGFTWPWFRLALAYFLVDTYPEIIGQFVGHSHAWVNGIESLFSQVLIIVLNYIISKFSSLQARKYINKKEVVGKCVKTISYQPPFWYNWRDLKIERWNMYVQLSQRLKDGNLRSERRKTLGCRQWSCLSSDLFTWKGLITSAIAGEVVKALESALANVSASGFKR